MCYFCQLVPKGTELPFNYHFKIKAINRALEKSIFFIHPSIIPPSINPSLHSSIYPFVRSSIEAKNVHIEKQQPLFGSCDLLWHLDMWWTEPAQLVQTKAFVSLPHTKSQNGWKTLVYSHLFWQFFPPFPTLAWERISFPQSSLIHIYEHLCETCVSSVGLLARMAFLWFEFASAIPANDCSFFSRVVITKEAAIVYQKKSAWKDKACA